MELGTVGAVLSFAIKLEGHSAEFYDQASSLAKDSPAEKVFLSLADVKRKGQKLVERSRQEYVNEMLLEPITGLKGSDHLLETRLTSDMDPSAALQLARELEQDSQALYLNAAEKISHLPQLARVLRRLGQQVADNKLRLLSLDTRQGLER